MANSKSAAKRIEIGERNRLQNRFYKSSVRTLMKVFLKDLDVYKNTKTPESKIKLEKNLSSIYRLIDKGTRKNIFHKNAAARKKAKLASSFKST